MLDTLRGPGEAGWVGVLCGDGASHSLALLLAASRAGERPILVLDGGNRFDPYLLSDLARTSGMDPDLLLSRVLVSRAFTCHQLHRLAVSLLPRAVREHRPALVAGIALDAPFHDGQVPQREARRLWREVLDALSETSRSVPVLLSAGPPPERGRPWLLHDLLRRARHRFRVERREGEVVVVRELPGRPDRPRETTATQVRCRGRRTAIDMSLIVYVK